MSKKTFNILSVCLGILMITFVITKKDSQRDIYTKNIGVDTGSTEEDKTLTETYQDQVLQAIFDQNIKSFESISESFKKKSTDTLSDTIAKNTFAQYINYNTTEKLDVETIKKETEAALKNNVVIKSNFGIQDIIISKDTISNLRKYGNEISVIQTEMNKSIYNTRNKNHKEIYIKNIYKTASNLYRKVSVPESLTKYHLGIINGYRDYVTGFELLELQTQDPAKALAGVQTAKEAQDVLVESFSSIKKIVLLNNITYTQTDPAYVWFSESSASPIKTN